MNTINDLKKAENEEKSLIGLGKCRGVLYMSVYSIVIF